MPKINYNNCHEWIPMKYQDTPGDVASYLGNCMQEMKGPEKIHLRLQFFQYQLRHFPAFEKYHREVSHFMSDIIHHISSSDKPKNYDVQFAALQMLLTQVPICHPSRLVPYDVEWMIRMVGAQERGIEATELMIGKLDTTYQWQYNPKNTALFLQAYHEDEWRLKQLDFWMSQCDRYNGMFFGFADGERMIAESFRDPVLQDRVERAIKAMGSVAGSTQLEAYNLARSVLYPDFWGPISNVYTWGGVRDFLTERLATITEADKRAEYIIYQIGHVPKTLKCASPMQFICDIVCLIPRPHFKERAAIITAMTKTLPCCRSDTFLTSTDVRYIARLLGVDKPVVSVIGDILPEDLTTGNKRKIGDVIDPNEQPAKRQCLDTSEPTYKLKLKFPSSMPNKEREELAGAVWANMDKPYQPGPPGLPGFALGMSTDVAELDWKSADYEHYYEFVPLKLQYEIKHSKSAEFTKEQLTPQLRECIWDRILECVRDAEMNASLPAGTIGTYLKIQVGTTTYRHSEGAFF